MAGHSRPKDGVVSARLCPGHPRLGRSKDVDARDVREAALRALGSVGIQDSHPGLVVIQALDGPIRFD